MGFTPGAELGCRYSTLRRRTYAEQTRQSGRRRNCQTANQSTTTQNATAQMIMAALVTETTPNGPFRSTAVARGCSSYAARRHMESDGLTKLTTVPTWRAVELPNM